jgi:tetratricopeptide (TPR) repeat protein
MIADAEMGLAEASWLLGEWQQARVHITRSTEVLHTLGSYYFLGGPELYLAELDIAEGDWEQAATSLDEIFGAELIGFPALLWAALRTRAELDLLQGRAADALARLQPLLTDAKRADAQWTGHHATLAEAYLEAGDSERARAVLDEGLALARAMHNRWDLLAMRRVEGMLLAQDGRWQEAEEAFGDALSLARHSSNPYEEARVLYEWGRMDRKTGAVQQAQEHWRKALTLFQRLGAKPYSERTEHLLAEVERCRT